MTARRAGGLRDRIARGAVLVAVGLLVLATLLSLIESNQWWIRIWDFPRQQILIGLAFAAAFAIRLRVPALGGVLALCALAAAWQLYRIHPYTMLARPEVALARDDAEGDPDACFSVMSLNVLQSNRDFVRTARLIDRERPDILLLMETDRTWLRALAPQLARYPHRLAAPLDNTYGLILATRLPMRDGRIEVLTEPQTPSATATLVAGRPFRVIALHPRPPHPGQDTDERDAEIAIAAIRAARARLPVLAIGDFNDVAWSHTSRLFKRVGGYLDPRVGRGTYPTFPAAVPILGWPLDHMFMTPEFQVRDLEVLDNVGSDHLPIAGRLCLSGGAPNARPDPLSTEDRRDVHEIIQDYRRDRREDAAARAR